MSTDDQLVLVLDDDSSIRQSLERLLTAHSYQVRLHADQDDFFRCGMPVAPACLLLDHELGNGVTGVQVYQEMQSRGWNLPTIFLTAHWNVQLVVSAMRNGADGFLTKPFEPAELVDAVAQALRRDGDKVMDGLDAAEARDRVGSLTAREREVVSLVIKGMLNKEIAHQLGVALVTVKVHRGRVMRKLRAGNAAELVRITTLAGMM